MVTSTTAHVLSFQTPADIGTMAGGAARSGGVSITGNATLDGPVVNTRFGPVQVEVVTVSGKTFQVARKVDPVPTRWGSTEPSWATRVVQLPHVVPLKMLA